MDPAAPHTSSDATWTITETSTLLDLVSTHDTDWNTIASHLCGKTPEDCSLWFEYLDLNTKYFIKRRKHKVQQCQQPRKRRKASQIERLYKCLERICNRSYGTEGALKMHIKLKHPGVAYNEAYQLQARKAAATLSQLDLDEGMCDDEDLHGTGYFPESYLPMRPRQQHQHQYQSQPQNMLYEVQYPGAQTCDSDPESDPEPPSKRQVPKKRSFADVCHMSGQPGMSNPKRFKPTVIANSPTSAPVVHGGAFYRFEPQRNGEQPFHFERTPGQPLQGQSDLPPITEHSRTQHQAASDMSPPQVMQINYLL